MRMLEEKSIGGWTLADSRVEDFHAVAQKVNSVLNSDDRIPLITGGLVYSLKAGKDRHLLMALRGDKVLVELVSDDGTGREKPLGYAEIPIDGFKVRKDRQGNVVVSGGGQSLTITHIR